MFFRHALGESKKEKARKSCAFCFWGCVFVGILLAALILIFIDPILNLIGASVLAIGVPAALGDVLMSVSQIIINSQMSHYGDMSVAGIGVAMKVITITGMICMGLGQGVQPILGYCVGAKTWKRFKEVFKFTIIFALILGTVLAAICYVFTDQIVSAFLTDQTAFPMQFSLQEYFFPPAFFSVYFMYWSMHFRQWELQRLRYSSV